MSVNRRKFLMTSVLGFIGYSVTNSLWANAITSIANSSPFNFKKSVTDPAVTQKLHEAAVLRKAGNLESAQLVYQEVIVLDSSEVRAYDGIRKILLHSKYKELEVLSLYNNGLAIHPDSKAFKERVAKEYMRLSLGNKKKQEALNNPESLLSTAKNYFQDLNQLHPDDKQIEAQYLKALQLIEKNADGVDARQNELMKDYKRVNRLNYKARFSGLTIEQTKEKLDELLAKTKNNYRDIHVRELYQVYIKKLKDAKRFDDAAKISRDLYAFDQKDSHALKLTRKLCRKDQKYEELEVIERNNEAVKQSFWAKIALFDCIYLRFRKQGIGSTSEMTSILNAASYKKFSFYQNYEFKIRQVKLAFAKNNSTEALTLLNDFGDWLLGTSSAHFLNRYNILCSKYYLKLNDMKKALQVINIAMNENDQQLTDPLLLKISAINKDKENIKPIHYERLVGYKNWLANKAS